MNTRYLLLAALVGACAPQPGANTSTLSQFETSDGGTDATPDAPPDAYLDPCAVPAAIPDDGLDDRAAIVAALSAQDCAHLVPGTYNIGTPSFIPPARRIYDMISMPAGSTIFGDGPASILKFGGDAQLQDWHGIGMASNTRLHDFTIDTAALVGTSEQTHAVQVQGPVGTYQVDHMYFNHPARANGTGTWPGGDCIRILGYASNFTLVTNGTIDHNDLTHCDRSGVAIHSGAQGLTISYNHFAGGDQNIDGEGSGDNTGWLLDHNIFDIDPTNTQGGAAIELDLVTHVVLTNNTFNGRGIFADSASYVTLGTQAGPNTFSLTWSGAQIEFLKDSHDVVIAFDVIDHAVSAGVAAPIYFAPHNSGQPKNVSVTDCTLTQEASADVIDSVGVDGLDIERNAMTYTGASQHVFSAVLANGSTTVRTTNIKLIGNSFTGAYLSDLRVSGSYAGTGSVTATDNTGTTGSTGSTQSLRCENVTTGSKVLGPVCAARDAWASVVCGAAGFVSPCP